ncbi:hypothetical protein V1507DRAFT_446736 [Lipomyces tetrasporus]
MAEPISPVFQFSTLPAPTSGQSMPPPSTPPQIPSTPGLMQQSAGTVFGTPPTAPNSSFTLSPSASFVDGAAGVAGPPKALAVVPDPTYPPCAANASVTMCPEDRKIYIFGGFDFTMSTDELFNSVMLIDTNTYKATSIKEPSGTIPSGRHGHTATYWKDGKLIIFGGENERGVFLNDLYVFDLRTLTWSSPTTYGRKPIGRSRHAACLSECGKRLYFCGGFRQHTVMSDIFCLDLETMTWSDSRHFVARYDHVATVHNEKVWIFGGLTQDMGRPSEVIWFDLRTSAVASLRFDEGINEGDDEDVLRIGNGRSRRGTPNPDKRAGTHFYAFCGSTVIDFMTHGPAIHNTETSITSFDLTEQRWRTLADSTCDIFSGNAWAYVALSGTTAFLLGSALYPESQYGIEHEVICRILPIDLKYYGAAPKQSLQPPTVPQPESLNADISALFDDPETSDFVITAIPDGHDGPGPTSVAGADSAGDTTQPIPVSDPIYVHALILQARWPHFKRLTNSRMREYHRKRMHIPEKCSTVRALLSYLYSDTIATTVSVVTVAKLLVLSNMYALPRLRDLCISRIQDGFDVANAPTIWECAKIAQEDVLRTSAARFCLRHWGRVVRTKAFRGLSKVAMLEICEEVDLEGQVVMGWDSHDRRHGSRSTASANEGDTSGAMLDDATSEADMAMAEDVDSDGEAEFDGDSAT